MKAPEPCCTAGPAGHSQQEHHDASPCYADACPYDHPAGGPFPHPCGPAVTAQPAAEDIAGALEVLRRAGWQVRDDEAFGRLIAGTGILQMAYAGVSEGWEQARTYRRTLAHQPWTPQ